MYEIIFLDEVGEKSRDTATSKETFDWKMSALKIAGATIIRSGKVSDTDRISPDEIGNVPDMKWFVRSKERNLDKNYYYFVGKRPEDYWQCYGYKRAAKKFDTKEEAELWTNPLTEAVQLPVEGE